jgi:predicted dehydrogenase
VYYENTLEMLKELRPEIVSICTPPFNRLELIQQIVNHTNADIIFCEKPVANSVEEARKLLVWYKNLVEAPVFIPNLIRRFNPGMRKVRTHIANEDYGKLNKMNLRYTRGILNTGAHLFDLVNWFAGKIEQVRTLAQVSTTADGDGDFSYSFQFITDTEVTGIAEAFDDRDYYVFEVDLYFEQGKIEISESGNKVKYFRKGEHPLFSGFNSLHLEGFEDRLLEEPSLAYAVDHLAQVRSEVETPICTLQDGVFPIFVAHAINRSSISHNWEHVSYDESEEVSR